MAAYRRISRDFGRWPRCGCPNAAISSVKKSITARKPSAMETVIGLVVVLLGLICRLGQTLVVLAPDVAVKPGVNEPKDAVDKSMCLFERYSQGIMDILLTWLLPVSALMMMMLDHAYWTIFALIGAGVYLYFPRGCSAAPALCSRETAWLLVVELPRSRHT